MNGLDMAINKPKLFALIRHEDESGISGTGYVLDGVIFHTGQVVICWRSDQNQKLEGYSSIAIYPSWEAFLYVHVHPHPIDATEIRFDTESHLDENKRLPEER